MTCILKYVLGKREIGWTITLIRNEARDSKQVMARIDLMLAKENCLC